MPNTETVRVLVSAFNVNNYFSNTVETNFTLQSRGKKDYIVVSFDKGMKDYQCSEYLYNIKRKIVGEFYGIEEGDTDEVVLNTAKLIFDVESFPFNNYKGSWSVGKHGGFEFVAPIDQGVIFNLKSHLASSLVKDVLEGMPTCSIVTNSFNKGKYLCHSKFPNKELRKQFEREFLSRMENRYGYRNVFKNPLKVEGNSVYIKDVFDDARFIDSVTRHNAWLTGMDLGVGNDVDERVRFKNMIIKSVYQAIEVMVDGFVCASPLDKEVASILIPLVLDSGRKRILTNEEALKLNYAFNYAVFNDLYGRTQGELSLNGSNIVYGIDFSNKEISHCVITKIIESSVINKDHELAIDPELHFRALSPPKTPPNQRNRDSGIGVSPLTKDSGSSSGGPGPSTELSDMEWESPTRSQDGALEGSPRQGLVSVLPLNPLDVPGTSGGPLTHLGYSTVSRGVAGPSSSSQSVGAAKNVQASTSASFQPMDRWSLPVFYAQSSDISVPRFQPPTQLSSSGPSSWKGAAQNVQASTSARAQQTNSRLSQGTSGNKWQPLQFTEPGFSGLSWKGANKSGSAWTSTGNPDPLPPPPPLIPLPVSGGSVSGFRPPVSFTSTRGPGSSPPPLIPSSGSVSGFQLPVARPSSSGGASERRTSDKPLTEKEEKLIEALLDMFNFNNYIGVVNTNFTLKDGKIIGFFYVDKREHLQEIRNDIIKRHCGTEEEARKVYDFNELPFFFSLSSYEKDPEKTVLTCNTSGAAFNFKIHLIQELKMDIEEKVIKELVKEMKITREEALKCIRGSVHLEKTNDPNSYLCDISFSNEYFRNQPELSNELEIDVETLFKEFKNIYVEEFKSRLKKCGLGDSLVSHEGNMLHIKNAIDIDVVKKVKKYEHEEAPVKYFPRKEVIMEVPIVLQNGRHTLDLSGISSETRPPLRQRARPIEGTSKAGNGKPEDNKDSGYSSGFVTDAENVSSKAEATTSGTSGYESMDCENPPTSDQKSTRRGSPKRKSSSSEEEDSPTSKFPKSESGSSSSEEEVGSPCSSFSDSGSEQLCKKLRGANLWSR